MSWICSLISLEMHETSSPPELSAREEEALKRTAKCLEGCRIADVCHTSHCTPSGQITCFIQAPRQVSQYPVPGCCRLQLELLVIVARLMIEKAAIYA